MSLLSRLESKFGRHAVPNLTVILIAGQVFVYLSNRLIEAEGRGSIIEKIWLLPEKVMQGEVWRLVTFLFDPPLSNPLFAFFFWYFFYMMGTTLETTWGKFRYNVFLAIGYFASIALACMIEFAVGMPGQIASNSFLFGSVFLAFARLYPDFVIYIFLILPVKMRWLALFTWISYGWSFISGGWIARAMVIAATLNFLMFFGRDILRDMKHGHRRKQHQSRTLKRPVSLVHECQTCGLTSEMDPKMTFRYCPQCDGQICYCKEHLRSHAHRAKETV